MSNAKRMALPGLFVALFALTLAPALVSPGPAVAQLTPPVATLYGAGLQEGDVVAALIDGVVCDTHAVSADDNGEWEVAIQAGNVAEAGPCGGVAVAGARITITVNGVTADQYVTWSPGYLPPDRANGITLTFASGEGSVPVGTTGATLSRSQGLAIFSGGSLDDIEAAALAVCPGGANIWANEPSGDSYLLYRANAPFPLVNAAFTRAYPDGFDGPEPVIVTGCTVAGS